jgi:hypothetical protein
MMADVVALLLVASAPLPFPRAAVTAPPPAVYRLHYHGVEYDVTLHGGGRYEAANGVSRWEGRWHAEGGTLVVREAAAGREADCEAGKTPWPLVWGPGAWGLDGSKPSVWLERVR